MFKAKNISETHPAAAVMRYETKTAARPTKIVCLALGLAATLLACSNGTDSAVNASKPNKNYTEPHILSSIPPLVHQRLIAPCDQPYQRLANQPNQSFLPNIDSDNPLLACLGSLAATCYDIGAPNGVLLCLDFATGSAYEEDGKPHIELNITANGNDFYDYTLYAPLEQCESAVATLNSYAREILGQLPAAGNITQSDDQIDASGLTTGCLTPERSAEIIFGLPAA